MQCRLAPGLCIKRLLGKRTTDECESGWALGWMDFFLVFGGCTLFRLPDEHKKLPNARIFAQESTAVVNIRAPILVGQDEVKLVITPGKYEIYPASSNSFVQDVFTFVSEIDTLLAMGRARVGLIDRVVAEPTREIGSRSHMCEN